MHLDTWRRRYGDWIMASSSLHDASASALGYLYQAKWALVELLRGARERPDGAISLELHDDVAWEVADRPVDLLQTKFHPRSLRTLGDRDDDLWRTIRSWMDTHDPGDVDGPWLTLVTTQQAREGTAAAALRGRNREPSVALRRLEQAAADSSAKETAETRARFLALSVGTRAVLVQRMRVIDGSPGIDDLDSAVREQLLFVLPSGDGPQAAFMEQLWAWWYEQVVDMLQKRRTSVSVDMVHRRVEQIRDDYTVGRLPTSVDRSDWLAARRAGEDYSERCFIHQLQWLDLGASELEKAMMDYYRAYNQAASWVDNDLIAIDELGRYQEELVDEWERHFARMLRRLPADATEEDRQQAGEELLWQVVENVTVRIRDQYDQIFFHRGQHHCLADEARVGWHPEFLQRVQALTLGAVHA
ncbi:ABC-three component system protein [Streptomyces pseudogriseolus]|uniref:ABC-three component system protein n=1 Tax=Streptomyces pseudogriseolus TaxID=36817 RepID=UPI003FA25F17